MYERGRALIPSWLAFSVVKLLETKFPRYVDYEFTADMESGLDQIASGQETGRNWLTRFYFGSGEGAAQSADEAHAGLQQQVAQLGEIDAREINTIEIGDGLHVRVGRYGPYLEDMNHLDDEGNPKRASLPDTLAPDELTVEVGHDLIENHSGGPRALGVDPVSGGTVEVRNGRFGQIFGDICKCIQTHFADTTFKLTDKTYRQIKVFRHLFLGDIFHFSAYFYA